MKKIISSSLALTLIAALITPAYAEVDVDAAKSLAKKNDCFKCHAVSQD